MKRTGFILFLCVFFLVSLSLTAQTYKGKARITGFVFDQDGTPIEGVNIKLFSMRAGAGFEIKSEKDGKWTAAWLRGGGWNLDFEKFGYEPKMISVSIQEMGKRLPPIEIRMKKVEGMVVSDDLKAELMKGNEFFNAGQFQEAIGVYTKMLEENPDIYILNKNIGNSYFEMEDYAQAMTLCQPGGKRDRPRMVQQGGIRQHPGCHRAVQHRHRAVQQRELQRGAAVLPAVGGDPVRQPGWDLSAGPVLLDHGQQG